ncbi:MAG: hypothetical protein QGH15_04590 [Kiritimatiellia bacterium]|nr:hypothetical protein [Kiritimatiellia bacterium]
MLKKLLKNEMKDVEEIVFAARVPGHDHWYANFGSYSCHDGICSKRGFKFEDNVYWAYGEGAKLCKLNLRTGKLDVLLDDPAGGIRDPKVHYDGRKILFSYRKGGTHNYLLYEIDCNGTNLVQLTHGIHDDIEPTYSPEDKIIFCSSRCNRFVNCMRTQVANVYTCDADGGNIRPLSTNVEHDNTPWLLPDGRVLYMRWEYVDRSQMNYHHLWTMNPDGTEQTVFFGNKNPGNAFLDAKPIPGSDRVVLSCSPGHGRPEHHGFIATVTEKNGPNDLTSLRKITRKPDYHDPYPFSENAFLAVDFRKGICVVDGDGSSEVIFPTPKEWRGRKLTLHEPRPLVPRPRERAVPSRVNLASKTGHVFLESVYIGEQMEGIQPGDIKKLLVLKQLPKPVNFSGGMEPLSIGGTFTLAGIVGTVPINADGSAFIELPAMESLFLVALDRNDRPVKRMRSFFTLQPGEVTGCVGCHESPNTAPVPRGRMLAAMKAGPVKATPIENVPPLIDFIRDVQPILDKHCVKCHSPDRRDGKTDLSADITPRYTMSYRTLSQQRLFHHGRNAVASNHKPYQYGSAVSPLLTKYALREKLEPGQARHHNVRISQHEHDILRLWIETSATFISTYAALDTTDYRVRLPRKTLANKCGACHRGLLPGTEDIGVNVQESIPVTLGLAINLSQPEKSLLLTAPLAKQAGGKGLCKNVLWSSKSDPLYQNLLMAIREASELQKTRKRWYMPGFRPSIHYIREMQRYGILPADLKPETPIDVPATDREYWDSFTRQ